MAKKKLDDELLSKEAQRLALLSQYGSVIEPTSPTFRDRLFNSLFDLMGGNSATGEERSRILRRARLGVDAADLTPLGILSDASQGMADYAEGRPLSGAANVAMAALGATPAGKPIKTAAQARKAGFTLDRAKLAEQYPQTGPSQIMTDKKSGKQFEAKQLTPEELILQAERNAAQKDIDAGNYTPYFDESQRYYANPENYNIVGNTLEDAIPKRADTIEKYKARFDTPEVRKSLEAAYERGLSPDSVNWYAMGQLEDAFIAELGFEEGTKQFRNRFADMMAATTGGADPTANLLTTSYINYMLEQGIPIPQNTFNFPHPIGGRYAAGNVAMGKSIGSGERQLSAADQPKRFNFAANFMGSRSPATIDEQMSGLFEKGLAAPPNNTYGIMEGVLADVAKSKGVQPSNFQDVAWAGAKGYEGKPMIRNINEMIERTSRITGETPDQVLKRFIRASGPMYGIGGLGILGYMDQRSRETQSTQ